MTIENAAPHNITFAFRSNDAYAAFEPDTTGELYAAPLLKRIVARVIDGIVMMFLLGVTQAFVVQPLLAMGFSAVIPAVFLALVLPCSLEIAMTASGGQSLGKRLAKIRVVRNGDGGEVGLGRSFVRAVAPSTVYFVAFAALAALGIDPMAGSLFSMAVYGVQLVLLWSARSRLIADRAAGTRVVDANPLGF